MDLADHDSNGGARGRRQEVLVSFRVGRCVSGLLVRRGPVGTIVGGLADSFHTEHFAQEAVSDLGSLGSNRILVG